MGSRLAVAALLLGIVLAGCYGGPGPGDPTATETTAPTPTDTATPTETATATPTETTTDGDGGGGDSGGGDTATPTDTPDPPEGTLEVHFVNVGQSVATLVVGPDGRTMLVDSGSFYHDGEYVIDYLRERNVSRLDYLVTSHADADHIGGHAAVIDYFETEGEGVGAVYDPGIAASTATYREYLDAVERHNVTLYETRAGDSIPFGDATVEVLGPPDPYLADRARNENSVVLRVRFGESTVLLTGDAESAQERHLVETYGDGLRADVLKAGHHGSKTSTGERLLAAVDPAVVVVSSAYDSRYDHPDKQTLDRLARRSVPTYWTGVHGHVVLETDGATIEVRTQRAATTDPLRLRDHPGVDPGSDAGLALRATVDATGGDLDVPPPEAGLSVAEVNADAAGDDRENLDDEYVVLANDGDDAVDLSGYTVTDEAGKTYTVPEGVTLEPGASVTLHTGSGTDGGGDLYWGSSTPVWNNAGDTVTVRDAAGEVVARRSYP